MLISLLKEIDFSAKRVKQFAYLFAFIGIILLPGIIFYKHEVVSQTVFISIFFGLIFLFLGLFKYEILIPIYKLWMLLALVLGLMMTKVIIALVFYFVMTPIGFVKRSYFKRLLNLDFKQKSETYWVKKVINEDPKRLERMF